MGLIWIISSVAIVLLLGFLAKTQGVALKIGGPGIMCTSLMLSYPLFHNGVELFSNKARLVVVIITIVSVLFDKRLPTSSK